MTSAKSDNKKPGSKKLPFEPTPQIKRYLGEILNLGENFFGQDMKNVFLIDRYMPEVDPVSYRSETNINAFWEYLEEIGGIKYLTDGEHAVLVNFPNIDGGGKLVFPKKEKIKILDAEKIRKINFDLFETNQKIKEEISAAKKNEMVDQKKSHSSNNPTISINLGKSKLVINKNTGSVGLNKTKSNLNPRGEEFRILLELATNKDYIATYEDLLGGTPTKGGRRSLSFIIRNIKEALQILPKKKARNKDIIKNMKGYGYRLGD